MNATVTHNMRGGTELFFNQASFAEFDSLLRGTGIITGFITVIGLVCYLIVKFGLARFVSVDEGTEMARARWGVAARYRTNLFGHEKGRIVRLGPGRHLLIRGFHEGWIIPKKEIVLTKERVETRCGSRGVVYDTVTLSYMADVPDTPDGDEALLRFFLSTRNIDRDDQKSESMDAKITGMVLAGFTLYQNDAPVDDHGFPRFNEEGFLETINPRIFEEHGARVVSLSATLPIWNQGQILADAVAKIAPNSLASVVTQLTMETA